MYEDIDGEEDRETALVVAHDAHNDAGVAVFEHCVPTVHKPKLCKELAQPYEEHDYADLMNTTFALIPSGHSPATHRLTEALSAGCIPVFIHTDFVKPFVEKIAWEEFSFTFSPENAHDILPTLRATSSEELTRMQVRALDMYVALHDHALTSSSGDVRRQTFRF